MPRPANGDPVRRWWVVATAWAMKLPGSNDTPGSSVESWVSAWRLQGQARPQLLGECPGTSAEPLQSECPPERPETRLQPCAKKRPGKRPGQVQQGGCRAITPTRQGEPSAQPVHARKVASESGNNKPQCARFWGCCMADAAAVPERHSVRQKQIRRPTDIRRFPSPEALHSRDQAQSSGAGGRCGFPAYGW